MIGKKGMNKIDFNDQRQFNDFMPRARQKCVDSVDCSWNQAKEMKTVVKKIQQHRERKRRN
jgi:hypothetical protein